MIIRWFYVLYFFNIHFPFVFLTSAHNSVIIRAVSKIKFSICRSTGHQQMICSQNLKIKWCFICCRTCINILISFNNRNYTVLALNKSKLTCLLHDSTIIIAVQKNTLKKLQKHTQASVTFFSHISLTYRMLVCYIGLLYYSHDSFLSNQYFLPTKSKSICPNPILRDSSCYKLCGILFFFDLT